jgi:hypothetical protein
LLIFEGGGPAVSKMKEVRTMATHFKRGDHVPVLASILVAEGVDAEGVDAFEETQVQKSPFF